MYLSTLFLETLGTDFSEENQKKAFQTVNQEFASRQPVPVQELLDTWDVMKDFNVSSLFTGSTYAPLFTAILEAYVSARYHSFSNYAKMNC